MEQPPESPKDLVLPHTTKSNQIKSLSERITWIDLARGFTIFYMIITLITPTGWFEGIPILEFFFVHPSRVPPNFHFIDLGAPGFVFILGLTYGITYQRRKAQYSQRNAIWHIVKHYAAVFILGSFILWASFQDGLIYETGDKWLSDGSRIKVFASDVIFVLGFVGFTGIPFILLKRHLRIFAAYTWVGVFAILCVLNEYTHIINFTVSSVHLGITGAIFGYGSIQAMGSAIGEYFAFTPPESRKKIYVRIFLQGIITLAIGIGFLRVPLLYLPALMFTAVGGAITLCYLFMFIGSKIGEGIGLLIGYGRNPFLIYCLSAIPFAIAEQVVDFPNSFEWTHFIIILVYWIALNVFVFFLYKKKVHIDTAKVAWITLIIVVILAFILIPLGII